MTTKPSEYYVLIRPWQVYVKEGRFFRNQGGLTEEWGKSWERIEAVSIENAREIGKVMQAKRKAELSAPAPAFPVQSELRVVNRAPDGEFICVMGQQGVVGSLEMEPVAPASPEFRGVYTLPERTFAKIEEKRKRDPWYIILLKAATVIAVAFAIGSMIGFMIRFTMQVYRSQHP